MLVPVERYCLRDQYTRHVSGCLEKNLKYQEKNLKHPYPTPENVFFRLFRQNEERFWNKNFEKKPEIRKFPENSHA